MLKYLASGLVLLCSAAQAGESVESSVRCLALASYYEVRAHSTEYLNVFNVIENRRKSLKLNYCEVVFQQHVVKIRNQPKIRYQFSWARYYKNQKPDMATYQKSLDQARDFLKKLPRDTTRGALYFTRHQDDQTWFVKNYKVVLRTPLHVYYGVKTTS